MLFVDALSNIYSVVNKQKSYLYNTALLTTAKDRVYVYFSENIRDSISNILRHNETYLGCQCI